MEVYEIVAICIGIVVTSFALTAISSIIYFIYVSCRGCIKPMPAPALDGTVITDKLNAISINFQKVLLRNTFEILEYLFINVFQRF